MSISSPDEEGSLLESYPCLLDFISTVVSKTSLDPGVISFALKLSGLMAATEDGFKKLQVKPHSTLYIFTKLFSPPATCEPSRHH